MRSLFLRNGFNNSNFLLNLMKANSFNRMGKFYIHQASQKRMELLAARYVVFQPKVYMSDAKAKPSGIKPDRKATIARVFGVTLICVSMILFMPIMVYFGQDILKN